MLGAPRRLRSLRGEALSAAPVAPELRHCALLKRIEAPPRRDKAGAQRSLARRGGRRKLARERAPPRKHRALPHGERGYGAADGVEPAIVSAAALHARGRSRSVCRMFYSAGGDDAEEHSVALADAMRACCRQWNGAIP